jgi:hypothetical protein
VAMVDSLYLFLASRKKHRLKEFENKVSSVKAWNEEGLTDKAMVEITHRGAS